MRFIINNCQFAQSRLPIFPLFTYLWLPHGHRIKNLVFGAKVSGAKVSCAPITGAKMPGVKTAVPNVPVRASQLSGSGNKKIGKFQGNSKGQSAENQKLSNFRVNSKSPNCCSRGHSSPGKNCKKKGRTSKYL